MRASRLGIRLVVAWGTLGLVGGAPTAGQEALPSGPSYTNSLGIRLVRIEPGRFLMGSPHGPTLPRQLLADPHFRVGDFDEQPAHEVTVSVPTASLGSKVIPAPSEQRTMSIGAGMGASPVFAYSIHNVASRRKPTC